MDILELEERASKGMPIPDGITRSQIWLYERFRALYHQLHIGAITREVATADKRRLIGEYNKLSSENDFREKQLAHTANLWRNIEGAANEYAKDRTIEHADRFYHAVYGVGFLKRDENKGENTK